MTSKLGKKRSPMPFLRALHHRPFRLLWSGQTISLLGDSIYQVALAWWVLQKTGSAVAMGMVFLFSFTPMVIFLLIGGAVVDRFPRIPLMAGLDGLRGLIVSIVALLAWTSHLELWQIYGASVLFGFVDAFFQPAYAAIIPEITPGNVLLSANSLTSVSTDIAGIIGPGLGAFLVAAGGTPLAFALDGLSFFISFLCVIPLLRVSFPRTVRTERVHLIQPIREGLRVVLASPWLWINTAAASVFTLTNGAPYAVTLPFLVKQALHAGVGVFGLIYTMTAIGSVLAAVLLGHTSTLRHRGLLAFGAWLLAGLARIAFGLPIPLPAVLCAAILTGVFISIGELIWANTLQELVPHDKLGRVTSIDLLCTRLPLLLGYGLIDIATAQLGPSAVFLITGAVTALVCLLGLAHPTIRRLE